jgi:hypothetical protein
MATVIVRVTERDVPVRMRDMRVWLDTHRFEPSMFKLQIAGPGRIVEVNFKVRVQAEAFAARFAGRLMTAAAGLHAPAHGLRTAGPPKRHGTPRPAPPTKRL